jgi:L-cysteine desulfidase
MIYSRGCKFDTHRGYSTGDIVVCEVIPKHINISYLNEKGVYIDFDNRDDGYEFHLLVDGERLRIAKMHRYCDGIQIAFTEFINDIIKYERSIKLNNILTK